MVLALLSVKGTKMCAIRHNSPCANVRQLFVSRREETLSTNSECWYLVPFGCLRADGGRETWQNSGFKETEGLGTGEQVCSEKNISTSKCQRWKNVHAGVDLSPYHWKQRNLKYAHSHQCFVSFLLHFLSSPNLTHTHTHSRAGGRPKWKITWQCLHSGLGVLLAVACNKILCVPKCTHIMCTLNSCTRSLYAN